MKHALGRERESRIDAINPSDEFGILPDFERVRVSFAMKHPVLSLHFLGDPGSRLPGAFDGLTSLEHLGERLIHRDPPLTLVFAKGFCAGAGDVELFEKKHGSRIGMEPRESFDATVGPRKKSMSIAIDQEIDRQVTADRDAIFVV